MIIQYVPQIPHMSLPVSYINNYKLQIEDYWEGTKSCWMTEDELDVAEVPCKTTELHVGALNRSPYKVKKNNASISYH